MSEECAVGELPSPVTAEDWNALTSEEVQALLDAAQPESYPDDGATYMERY